MRGAPGVVASAVGCARGEPGAALGEESLIAWAREQMAAFKYPRSVTFVDALPMTATGKVLKRELRANAAT